MKLAVIGPDVDFEGKYTKMNSCFLSTATTETTRPKKGVQFKKIVMYLCRSFWRTVSFGAFGRICLLTM